MSTNVLVIGSGAREHALAWKLRQSSNVADIFIAPGNPGTAELGENVTVALSDFDSIAAAARDRRVGLIVVGPEGPLAEGLTDRLAALDVPIYGPTQTAAQIESSKSFAKQLMSEASIPTARGAVFRDFESAAAHVRASTSPPVIKADGLAGGKGVTVPNDVPEAIDALRAAMLEGQFGAAGHTVVVEERLFGREVSAHAFCDGTIARPMPYSCDHKTVYDGGRGPNTGGMGAYSPPDFMDEGLSEAVRQQVILPALRALAARGAPFRGTLYPGLMITESGPKVIEFNCRFGDPETQVLIPRLESDLFEPVMACASGSLATTEIRWSDRSAVAVVLTAGGYPGTYQTGAPITGLDELDSDVLVFQAGTTRDAHGQLVTAGGRVLTVVGMGSSLQAARERAYANVKRVRFAGRHFRSDIGLGLD